MWLMVQTVLMQLSIQGYKVLTVIIFLLGYICYNDISKILFAISKTKSFTSDTLRRISRATTTALEELDEGDQKLQDVNKDLTPQFSHKIVVAIDFGTTYRYHKASF